MSTSELAAREIEDLDRAVGSVPFWKYLRYESIDRALERIKFPYRLVQTWDRGRYLYNWTGDWDKGAIYVQETECGRRPVPGIQKAVAALRRVLSAFAATKGGKE